MTGLTFGKYYPFHRGHAALIGFAARHCDRLIVLVCASDRERIPAAVRATWIRDQFSNLPKIEVRELDYTEADLPNSSVASEEISRVWSGLFLKILPPVQLVITSEEYGPMVARYLNCRHLSFDPARSSVPVSATRIRQNLWANWHYLPESVQRHFQRTVVLLGTESTGKSTLAKWLSNQLPATLVEEVGRELVPLSEEVSRTQLLQIALLHAERIEQARATLMPLVIVDTDVYITQSYAKFTFDNYLKLPKQIYQANRADLRLYLNVEVPFVQDGTRLSEDRRNELDRSHRATLAHFGVAFTEIGEDWTMRRQKALDAIVQFSVL